MAKNRYYVLTGDRATNDYGSDELWERCGRNRQRIFISTCSRTARNIAKLLNAQEKQRE